MGPNLRSLVAKVNLENQIAMLCFVSDLSSDFWPILCSQGLPRSSRAYFLILLLLLRSQSYRWQRLATSSLSPWWKINQNLEKSICILISAIGLSGKRSVITPVWEYVNRLAPWFIGGYVFKFGLGNKSWILFSLVKRKRQHVHSCFAFLHISQKSRP